MLEYCIQSKTPASLCLNSLVFCSVKLCTWLEGHSDNTVTMGQADDNCHNWRLGAGSDQRTRTSLSGKSTEEVLFFDQRKRSPSGAPSIVSLFISNLVRLVAQKEVACTRLDLGVWGVGCGAVSSVGIERGINLSLPEVS